VRQRAIVAPFSARPPGCDRRLSEQARTNRGERELVDRVLTRHRVSQLIEQPARAEAPATGRIDACAQPPVGTHHIDFGAGSDLPGYLRDDSVVTAAVCMLDAEPLLVFLGVTASRRTLENEDYCVVRQLRGIEFFGQPARSAGSVAPPAVGSAAHDVRAVDDEDVHLASSA